MKMSSTQTHLGEYVLSLLDKGMGREEIEAELLSKGHDAGFISELMKESVKLRASKRMAGALTWIFAGVVICFSSFLLTITGFSSLSTLPVVLYGLTGIGIVFISIGFMKIF
jgi:hypothetical protein